jgi:hypothetical protein
MDDPKQPPPREPLPARSLALLIAVERDGLDDELDALLGSDEGEDAA